MPDLWNSSAQRKWREALDRYEDARGGRLSEVIVAAVAKEVCG